MPTFPRVGTELSSIASVVPSPGNTGVWERPGLIVRMGDGYTERRSDGDVDRLRDIFVDFVVNDADRAVIQTFLRARSYYVEPFTLVHSKYGSITVNYAEMTMPEGLPINGPSGSNWWSFTLHFEGHF